MKILTVIIRQFTTRVFQMHRLMVLGLQCEMIGQEKLEKIGADMLGQDKMI